MNKNRQRPSIAILVTATVSMCVAQLPAAIAGGWTSAAVCGAGVYNYFFLKSAPERIGESDGWHVFRSASGGTYDCQLQGDIVAFRWKNDSGPMSSQSTRVEMDGDSLVLHGDFGRARFRLTGETWSPVE